MLKAAPATEDDHLVGVADAGQAGCVVLALAFDHAHVGKLWQRDVAAERDGGDAPVHAVAPPAHDPGAEADREAVDDQPPPARGQEVSQLVHED
jgi:hypothetical protein